MERRVFGGGAHSELVQIRVPDKDRARLTQVFRQRRFIRRNHSIKRERASGGRHVGCVDIVFEGDGYAVQRPTDLALRALAIESLGFLDRMKVHYDHRIELVLVCRDAREILLDDLARGYAAFRHRSLHLANG